MDTRERAKDLRNWADDLRKQHVATTDWASIARVTAEIEKAAAFNELAYALSLLAHKWSRG